MRSLWPSLLVLLAACAYLPPQIEPVPGPEPPAAPRHGQRGASEPVTLPHRVVDGATGEALGAEALRARIAAASVVYVGEQHNSPHDHAAQLEVLVEVHAVEPSLGLGMEMLPRTMQAPLADFVGGRTDEAGFLRAVDWPRTWGYPFGLYRPLLAFCRAHGLPAYALNAPPGLARAVSQRGLDGLTPEERRELPEIRPGPEEHRAFFRRAMAGHGQLDPAKLERYYAAQLVWDESMAREAAAALGATGAPRRLVVVAGDGHVRRFAIPERAARRGAGAFLVVIPVLEENAAELVKERAADVLWVLQSR